MEAAFRPGVAVRATGTGRTGRCRTGHGLLGPVRRGGAGHI